MDLCYAQTPLPNRVTKSLFLAGPTPRAALDPNAGWREEALAILADLGYDGVVYLPETPGHVYNDYDAQLDWEVAARARADIEIFWVPRDLATMPAFTTNIEFGEDLESGRILYGRPDDAPKNKYLDLRYTQVTGMTPHTTLRALLTDAVACLGAGAERVNGEASVPLTTWRHPAFQAWYTALRDVGNLLTSFHLLRTISHQPNPHQQAFGFLAKASVFVTKENRTKHNEVFIARPDSVSVVPLIPSSKGWQVVLTQEFRTAVANPLGLLIEPPGGSSPHQTDSRLVAVEELQEELGLSIKANRLVPLAQRQASASLASHTVTAFALVLSPEEADQIYDHIAQGTVLGTQDDEGERITLTVALANTLHTLPLDWTSYGVVQAALRMITEQEPS